MLRSLRNGVDGNVYVLSPYTQWYMPTSWLRMVSGDWWRRNLVTQRGLTRQTDCILISNVASVPRSWRGKTMNRRFLPIGLVAAMAVVAARGGVLRVPDEHRSIGAAMHACHEGDTIRLAPGIYKEQVVLLDRVALIGDIREEVIIVGKENEPVVEGANGALVRAVTIKGGSAGIRCENKVMTIEGNLITENREAGIHALVSLPMIRNNVIVRNDWTGIYCESANALKTRVEHNVIAENRYSGITLAGKSQMIIQNNIICNNGEFGVWLSAESRRTRIEYNAFFNNRRRHNQYARVGNTNQTLDPMFPPVRADVYNYLKPPERSFEGMGRDGAAIGLVSEEQLARDIKDKDRDGVPDDVDQCAGMAEDKDGFQDDDGCPDFDNDGDGFYDRQERCDNEPEDVDGFEDLDGCPDPDNDHDGIPDTDDRCPDQAETVNGYKDDDGCPDEKPGGE
ncbi:MAG: DUF1565 domain-containing protein [Chitinivibrionales bacterium]|nr:DUF1565 domain-containing protein [Chitinivibrionales bacterium]